MNVERARSPAPDGTLTKLWEGEVDDRHFFRLRVLRALVHVECVTVWARGVRLGHVHLGAVGWWVIAVELMWQAVLATNSRDAELHTG